MYVYIDCRKAYINNDTYRRDYNNSNVLEEKCYWILIVNLMYIETEMKIVVELLKEMICFCI